eukprot:4499540-Pyramimonas_sp.AAC.1
MMRLALERGGHVVSCVRGPREDTFAERRGPNLRLASARGATIFACPRPPERGPTFACQILLHASNNTVQFLIRAPRADHVLKNTGI